jgi:hypothetical protein
LCIIDGSFIWSLIDECPCNRRAARPSWKAGATPWTRPKIRAEAFNANLQIGHPMTHKFTIGQAVDLQRTVLRPASPGEYEIRQLLPAGDSDPEDPRYRVKNTREKHERVVRESEISLAKPRHLLFY